jgi:hypothetical protein
LDSGALMASVMKVAEGAFVRHFNKYVFMKGSEAEERRAIFEAHLFSLDPLMFFQLHDAALFGGSYITAPDEQLSPGETIMQALKGSFARDSRLRTESARRFAWLNCFSKRSVSQERRQSVRAEDRQASQVYMRRRSTVRRLL